MNYNYVYVDPRRPGKFDYDGLDVSFLFEPFYVGKGTANRWKHHTLYVDSFPNSKKRAKIKKIIKEKYDPLSYVVILNRNSSKLALEYEKFMILHIGRICDNGPLLNITEGGDGGDTISNHPNRDDIIKRIKCTTALRDKQSWKVAAEKRRGQHRSLETKIKQSDSRKKFLNENPRAIDDMRNRMLINNPMSGKHHTDETKMKLAAANKNKKRTGECRDKMKMNSGKKKTWYLIDPNSEFHIVHYGFSDFVKNNNLSMTMLKSNLNKGKISLSDKATRISQEGHNTVGWFIWDKDPRQTDLRSIPTTMSV